MYLQLWPGASLLGFNLIQFQQMRSENAGCRDRQQITQASVFEVCTVRTRIHYEEEGLWCVCEKEWLSVFFWVVQKDRAYLCVYVQV